MNYPRKPDFNLYQSRHCAYITYSVNTWVFRILSVAPGSNVLDLDLRKTVLLQEPPFLVAEHVGGDGLQGLDPQLILLVVVAGLFRSNSTIKKQVTFFSRSFS